jgi:molybdopterin-guanine dinucleotide biosynthesis protein A
MSDPTQRIDAVLPAGGRVSGEFAQAAGAEVKALIEFGGISVLERTIKALCGIGGIGRIVVVGPESTHAPSHTAGANAALLERDSGSANILYGIEWLQTQPNAGERVVVVTTDMPFLTSQSIERFLAACPHDRDICVPVVERTPFEAVYPNLIRTDTRLADGWFRLGGLFLLRPAAILNNRQHFESAFAARKSNLAMAKMIGIRTALRYLTRRLSSEDIAACAGEILRCKGSVIKDMPPEIGFDIDLLEEYAYAARRFSERGEEG